MDVLTAGLARPFAFAVCKACAASVETSRRRCGMIRFSSLVF
jgi:hypothetical protein